MFALGYANAAIERYYLVPLLVAALWAALAVDVLWDGALLRIDRLRGVRPSAVRAGGGRTGQRRQVGAARRRAPRRWHPRRCRRPRVRGGPVRQPRRLEATRFGRVWLEAAFEHLEPDAAVVSWWSFSTPLWYGRWVEGRRPDILIIDDRDILDDGYGTASAAIDQYLPERPVYLVRLERDLPPSSSDTCSSGSRAYPSPGDLYRVVERRSGA